MAAFEANLAALLQNGQLLQVKKKTSLLLEGEVCHKVFLIEQGIVRSWFNNDGDDITFQFYFAGDIVTSSQSLKSQKAALYNIEALTDVRLKVLNKAQVLALLTAAPALQQWVNEYVAERLYHYQKLFISRIKNNPQQRYEELLASQPEIFDFVPHHYIASYLGMTPVSLSRIRAKKNSSINNC